VTSKRQRRRRTEIPRITTAGQLETLEPKELQKRLRPIVRSYVRKATSEEVDALMEGALLAAVEVAKMYELDPSLDNRAVVPFGEFLPAKLKWPLIEVDRKSRPQMYDDRGIYLGAGGSLEVREPESPDERVEKRTQLLPVASTVEIAKARETRHAQLASAIDPQSIGNPNPNERDSVSFEAIHGAAAEHIRTEELDRTRFGRFLDDFGRMLRQRYPVASTLPPMRWLVREWDEGLLTPRQKGKELGYEDYKTRPPTQMANELNEALGEIGFGSETPAKPFKYRKGKDII
jgi:hypothetical protein